MLLNFNKKKIKTLSQDIAIIPVNLTPNFAGGTNGYYTGKKNDYACPISDPPCQSGFTTSVC
ncbi:hypothetical protein CWB96_12875 [Pseudoalteromonas citrea]|uniref:Uncharacterized protein n=1 Tax=Pseudoalteromonas citrea TaxID=43655 RepID=A0A5S3XQ05_9GAMM|nr:hypothetical protein [Pseudoalteromonas citrea]TMP40257.1 hypothetical protein CWB97_19170 [Pseudoalteromonas citrea]TMP57991.1 hypothetical protein CWB96_12875 [Pseudoalteromonas citrea]